MSAKARPPCEPPRALLRAVSKRHQQKIKTKENGKQNRSRENGVFFSTFYVCDCVCEFLVPPLSTIFTVSKHRDNI